MNSTDPFEAIVSEHYEPLYRFAMSLTRAESDASDVIQQTFFVWATKGHQVRDPAKIKTWLFTTLYRAFLTLKRKHYRFSHSELENEVVENMQADSPEPSAQADVCQVLPALAKVDKCYQAAVALYYLDDCSYQEIAAILEVPIGRSSHALRAASRGFKKFWIATSQDANTSHGTQVPLVVRNLSPASES